jgi:hypothetical protein
MTLVHASPTAKAIDLEIDVPRREVLRNLGYPRAKQPAARVKRVLEEIWDEAISLIRPRGAYRVASSEQAAAAGMPEPTELVGLGLCTIGPALEAREHRLGQQSQVLEALVLDAFGSAAAEAAADALNLRICQEAQALGYQLPRRISPGYGRWRIEGQRELLSLLEMEAVGVRLTEGLMMVPRKSISFGVRFLKHAPPPQLAARRCASCDLEGCAYRAGAEDGPDAPEGENRRTKGVR